MKLMALFLVFLQQYTTVSSDQLSSLPQCLQCYQYAEKSLANLLNVILNIGIVGDCKDLCDYLRSPTQQSGCQLYCAQSGIQTFVTAITQSNSDAIYFCELIDQCGFIPDGDAEIQNAVLTTDPLKIDVEIKTNHGTGAGEILLEFTSNDKSLPIGMNYPVTETKPGVHKYHIALNKPDCTSSDCLQLKPGDYSLKISLCSCKCGSHHANSHVYDTVTLKITVTESFLK